ncbi:FMN-dependent NADH-azoreductase [Peribacillus deserti]|uniref:FMN dependent NADH:quinone oxidoreductase n=1 Tax=Peribacillus deserti TaxID=673318 RepID=A0ABS2QIV7_9BACI|nr:FMN-dependent NADH-azoreductase [Peribacillus deserti]MBM7693091.1 FMN-dependent NADH-azoreductase [Peribacillus deserti]
MTKVLYVKANPKEDQFSFSARVANEFINTYKEKNSSDEIEVLDLYSTNLPLIDRDVLNAWGKIAAGGELTENENAKVSRLVELVDQFLAADKVVFSAPMWNFGYPPLMKAYLDALCVAGKTFKYTENGPVGLAGDKSVALIEARGGIYSEGPAMEVEHTESFFKTIMGFIGINNVQTVLVEGVAIDPSKAEDIVGEAASKAIELAKQF